MKGTFPLNLAVSALLGASPLVQPALAQISVNSLAGGAYSQDFDSLASLGTGIPWIDNSTLPGWYAARENSGSPSSFTTYNASTGSSTAGALYSFGASGSSERALGSIASGNASIGDIAYGVRFVNDTGSDITSITISYTGEQWRNSGSANVQALAFSYLVSDTPITDADPLNAYAWSAFTALDFNSPTFGGTAGALDGNASVNQQVFSEVVLAGVVVPAGDEIFLRWRDVDDSGSDHGMAIDNLVVSFNGGTIVTNAPTYALVTPLALTNRAGTTASFTVASDGFPNVSLSYQWRKDGFSLGDFGNTYGSATPTLTLSNVVAGDAGSYDVIVANSAGAVTSAAATLSVIDPVIVSQSADQSRLVGDNVTLGVTAAGTPTLFYQWFVGNTPIPDAIYGDLTLSSLQTTDQGVYTCWVTNYLGDSVASSPITLTVTAVPSTTLALWDFNDTNAPLASPPPAIGAGTASLLDGVTATFATGAFSDPGGTNRAWNTANYPPERTDNKQAGAQFNVSTLGYHNILLAWQERHSNTASKYTRLQYTTDGVNFVDGDVFTMLSTDNSFVGYISSLGGISGVGNNPNFAFRIVSEWEATAIGNDNSNYVGTVTSYSPSGTIRLDLISVYGDPGTGPVVASTTISNLAGTTLSYGGGAGSRFVLLKSANPAAPMNSWTRVSTNFVTPGTFAVPAGSGGTVFYRIKSE